MMFAVHEVFPLDDISVYIHFLSNNVMMKNKVLSYHGLNSGKSSTVADYLHFPSNKNTNTFFLAFYSENFDEISNFGNTSQP